MIRRASTTSRSVRGRHLKKHGLQGPMKLVALMTLVLSIAAVASGIVLSIADANRCNVDCEVLQVSVVPGDTLWGIAKSHFDAEVDLRMAVDNIMRENNLTSSVLRPGQVLQITIPR